MKKGGEDKLSKHFEVVVLKALKRAPTLVLQGRKAFPDLPPAVFTVCRIVADVHTWCSQEVGSHK